MWPDLIKKAKEGGLDAIETYVFWNAHEPSRRVYDFSANNDLITFLKTIQDSGLYAILRIGPYVCAEWNYGYIISSPISFQSLLLSYLREFKVCKIFHVSEGFLCGFTIYPVLRSGPSIMSLW